MHTYFPFSNRYGRIADSRWESRAPDLWPIAAYVPSLSPSANTIRSLTRLGPVGTLDNFTFANAWTHSNDSRYARARVIETDGNDDSISVSMTEAYMQPAHLSVVWDGVPIALGNFDGFVFGADTANQDWNEGWGMYWRSTSPELAAFINNWSANRALAVYNTTGERLQIVMTYDRQNIRLYINGTEAASTAYTAAIDYTSVDTIRIMRAQHTTSTSLTLQGQLFAFALYGRALTAAQVAKLFVDPLLPFEAEPYPIPKSAAAAPSTNELFYSRRFVSVP